ncbi:MAG TPA: transcription elongation factor GreA, partial [Actinobacteria bacterium]|nr:transcription elongation factor GreA [Actinomycetota bacterium]
MTNSEVVLTPEGYKKLLDELDYLIKKRRREI